MPITKFLASVSTIVGNLRLKCPSISTRIHTDLSLLNDFLDSVDQVNLFPFNSSFIKFGSDLTPLKKLFMNHQ
jgi:hypothetical protein